MSVLLKKPFFKGVSQKELAEQLEAKKKCKNKLPTWFGTPNIYYPNKLNIEQTSSEITAAYKAQLIDGESLLDMTGGFGVDSFYFSKKVGQVTHCEVDKNLSQMAAYNFEKLGVTNCRFEPKDGIHFLEGGHQKFNWIFADPSRRHDVKGKVFRLEDCEPNIPKNLDSIFNHTDCILLKTSPLLDLTLAVKELKNVFQIHVIAVQNEVKEVLFILKKEVGEALKVSTVNLKRGEEIHFEFQLNSEKAGEVDYSTPENYLYEPNAAILKAGGFNSVGMQLGLKKIAPHSHLYTSQDLVDFPGRIFKIQDVRPYTKGTMKALKGTKANLTIRNFPESVQQLRKKYQISDGGDNYFFFSTDRNGDKVVINCTKV